MIVTTANEIAGHRVVRHVALVSGVTTRSRTVIGNKLTMYEAARQEALDHLVEHAAAAGANAVIAMRYNANAITDGITEVLAYGAAVVVEPV